MAKKMERYDIKPVKPVKPKPMEMACEPSKEGYRPRVYLNSREVPDLKDWEIGKDYLLRVRMTGKSLNEGEGKEKQASGNFEVIGAGHDPEAGEKK